MSKKQPLRLRKRAEFLAVRMGEKRRGRFFLLEVHQRTSTSFEGQNKQDKDKQNTKNNSAKEPLLPRVGFTVTRKNGNAVKRNRIKRRLREALRVGIMQDDIALMRDMEAQTDYVIVARKDALKASFLQLIRELRHRIAKKTKRE